MQDTNRVSVQGSRLAFALPVAMLLAMGCASEAEVPAATTESITIAETTVRQAEQAGAAEHAAAELDSAREKLAEARGLAGDEPTRADRLALEAAVDAELAASMAREGQAEAAVAEIEENIRVLRAETAR